MASFQLCRVRDAASPDTAQSSSGVLGWTSAREFRGTLSAHSLRAVATGMARGQGCGCGKGTQPCDDLHRLAPQRNEDGLLLSRLKAVEYRAESISRMEAGAAPATPARAALDDSSSLSRSCRQGARCVPALSRGQHAGLTLCLRPMGPSQNCVSLIVHHGSAAPQ